MFNSMKRLDNPTSKPLRTSMKIKSNFDFDAPILEQHASDEESNMNFESLRSPMSNSNDGKTISENNPRTSRSNSQNFTFAGEF
jgi:hypothetical protein